MLYDVEYSQKSHNWLRKTLGLRLDSFPEGSVLSCVQNCLWHWRQSQQEPRTAVNEQFPFCCPKSNFDSSSLSPVMSYPTLPPSVLLDKFILAVIVCYRVG